MKAKKRERKDCKLNASNGQIGKGIDWLTFTFDKSPAGLFLYRGGYENKPSRVKHYVEHLDWGNGISILVSENPIQGNLCQITGTGMRSLRDSGLSDVETLTHVAHSARNVSRLDYAIDYFGSDGNVADFDTAMDNETVHNLGSKGTTHIKGKRRKRGETLYIGSRTSDWCMRIYDKAAKEKMKGVSWVRLEMETKNMVAKSATQIVSKSRVITSLDAMILQKFDPRDGVGWSGQLFDDSILPENLARVEKGTDYSVWIEQVKKSITKKVITGKEIETIAKFRLWLNDIDIYQSVKIDTE